MIQQLLIVTNYTVIHVVLSVFDFTISTLSPRSPTVAPFAMENA